MWPSRLLTLFHGTDDHSIAGASFGPPLAPNTSLPRFAVSLSRCKPLTDFGQGFYTTTSFHQAREWANTRTRRLSRSGSAQAVVLRFVVDLDRLAALESLVFVRATPDYWSFVGACRGGTTPHGRSGPVQAFDAVFGPVTIWPQRLLISDCDQISFHTTNAVAILGHPVVHAIGQLPSGFFP